MSNRREIITGFIAALISVSIIFGSIVVANTETRSILAQEESPTITFTSRPTQIIILTQSPGEPTYTPSPTTSPSATATELPPPTNCPPPPGWSRITIQPGDTLDSIARTYNTTPELLFQANCLPPDSTLNPGILIYVPGKPPPTSPPCGPPSGWVYYIVKSGDTLYSIGQAHRTSVAALQRANCMGSSTTIRVGQRLYVPYVPTAVPTATNTPTPTFTPSPTLTLIPPSPTSTVPAPTITPSETLTPTLTEAPPQLPTGTSTPTPTPTDGTPAPSETPSAPSETPTPTASPTEEPTPTTEPPSATPTETTAPPQKPSDTPTTP